MQALTRVLSPLPGASDALRALRQMEGSTQNPHLGKRSGCKAEWKFPWLSLLFLQHEKVLFQ